MISSKTLMKMSKNLSLRGRGTGGRLNITAWLGEGIPKGEPGLRGKPCPSREREDPGWGSQKKAELRGEEEPLGHLEKKGSSVLLLQGLLQLSHITLQLQILIPGIFHLLLAKETLLILSCPLAPRSLMSTYAPDHC